ncbi:MAG: hypothetical protein Kow0070_06330 [Anaerolineales bacterium]
MKAKVKAKGYTNVVLVLNMKRFVAEKDRERFERLRGTREFANILRDIWHSQALTSGYFETVAQEKLHRDINDEMSTEEVGFATGIFRSPMLEDFTFPTYALVKEKYEFPNHLMGNYQFKNLFLKAWKDWRVFVRPSFTGLFVIRLTRSYEKATPLMDITHDVIKLQESLDVQSARRRLAELPGIYANQPGELEKNRNSVLKFLEWLGADESTPTRLLYSPVQWKLAMEVCKIFVEAVRFAIPTGREAIQLVHPEPKLSNPLHDSYVIYHLDQVWANRQFSCKTGEPSTTPDETRTPEIFETSDMRPVRPQHIRCSLDLQQQFASLIEGALLKGAKNTENADETEQHETDGDHKSKYAPRFEPRLAQKIIESDAATWEDELCLLTPRATLLIPSYRLRDHELLIATLPGSTSRFRYVRYWGAIERMIEFVIEIHVLARLLERRSFSLLEEMADIMHEIRHWLFLGDIRLHERLPVLITDAAHLRRLTAFCQGLSDPHFWSRAEYATGKAGVLMEQLGLPGMLNQIERNIISINSVVDHVDEWYMADLAEQSNDMATLLSLGLAAASFVLTLLILPSFWADLDQVAFLPDNIKKWMNYGGSFLAVTLIATGGAFSILALRYVPQITKIMGRSLVRLKKTFQRAK